MNVEEMLAQARSVIERAAPDELAEAASDAIVIDLRCADERRRTGVIPGSIAIGRSALEWRCDPASRWRDERVSRPQDRVVLVCEQGYSSSLAAESLHRLGFSRVGDLIGGMERWMEEGLPLAADDARDSGDPSSV